MEEQNLDVSLAGVSAYSTLDWLNKPWLPNYFSDPVLSTFLLKHDAELIATLIHEMAHQIVYVKNDTTFNESFATFVEQEGLLQFLTEKENSILITIFTLFVPCTVPLAKLKTPYPILLRQIDSASNTSSSNLSPLCLHKKYYQFTLVTPTTFNCAPPWPLRINFGVH